MFEQYPKTRPPLPKQFEEIYTAHYRSNREGGTAAASLANRLEAWMHRKVAADVVKPSITQKSTLEIGAGTLNQLPFEPEAGPYDIIEPFQTLYAGSPHLGRIRHVYSDIAEIPEESRYDRITSIATFEHLLDLPAMVARAGLLLAKDGVLRVAVPSEGTILWTLGWKLTTGVEFRLKYGLNYALLMRHEHINTAREIEQVLRYFFERVECSCLGPARPLSFYQFFACSGPRTEQCRTYAGRTGNQAMPR